MTLQTATLFPDAEQVVINYLRAQTALRTEPYLSGVVFGNWVPSPRPARYVHVRRSGGVQSAPTIEQPRVDIECWAAKWEDAADIARFMKALVYTMQNRTPVRQVSDFLGLTPIRDPLSDQPRYLFTVELTMRGEAFTL